MARNVILTGGHTHAFPVASAALARLLGEHAIESTIDDDIERGLRTVDADRPQLLTVYALRWSMRDGEKYAPYRAQWAFSLSERGRAAIARHLERGGGLLALHTAIICFDDWPEWARLLGGAWVWGASGHPPYGPVDARFAQPAHSLVRGLPAFTIDDEAYGGLAFEDGVRPLMQVRAAGGEWQPALWTHAARAGRVVVDTLGHDAQAFAHPVHRRIVARAAAWALGRDDDEVASA